MERKKPAVKTTKPSSTRAAKLEKKSLKTLAPTKDEQVKGGPFRRM